MSFFLNIPTELQLRVLENVSVDTLQNLLITDKYFNSITLSSIHSTVNTLTASDDRFYFSVFSPQVKTHLIQTFNTTCVSTPIQNSQINTPLKTESDDKTLLVDLNRVSEKLNLISSNSSLFQSMNYNSNSFSPYKSVFKLGDLQYTRNPLKYNSTNVPANEDSTTSLSLVVNEDEPYINIQFEMQMKKDISSDNLSSLFKVHSRISPLKEIGASSTGVLYSDDKAVMVEYSILKESEVPPYNGYDYDVFHNYKINFGNIEINNTYLLDCIEG